MIDPEGPARLPFEEMEEFEAFFHQTYDYVSDKARRMAGVRYKDEADSVVDRAYLQVMRDWHQVRALLHPRQRGWIISVAIDEFQAYPKREKQAPPYPRHCIEHFIRICESPGLVDIAEYDIDYSLAIDIAQEYIDGIRRKVFLLASLDYRTSEIVEMTGLTGAHIRVQLMKARDDLYGPEE